MKKYILFAASSLFAVNSAFAYIPASAVTTLSLPVYGIYTSADPTCVTGMTATVALTKTPQQINMVANPTIGSGSVPSTIGCVVIVVGNNLSNAWASGSYASDAACNSGSGGIISGQAICGSGGANTVSWPQQITTDAAAIGLTLTTGSCSGQNSEVVPLVLSTNSICTGQAAADASTPACLNVNMNNWTLPVTTADATHGTKLVAPSTSGDLKFIVNPANTLGVGGNGQCGNQKAPLFSFAAN